ncbi:alkaline phosphatase family protein [Candidatus Woesearchaeota archaeon]|nr:alkaline phosphatase family protein [Candidatus Woesearchaeota archaeon]
MGKVFLFGIDGGVPDLVFERWNNLLPNIQKLMEHGTYARMNSTIPPSTIVAWNAMISGKDPSEIGVFNYTYKDEQGEYRLVSSKNNKARLVWDIIGDEKRKSIALYVPLSYPVTMFPGCIVTDFMTPGVESNCAYPESLKDKIKALGNPEGFFDVAVGLGSHKSLDPGELVSRAKEMTNMQVSLLKDLIVNEEWDFCMAVMLGTDRLQHMLWRHFDEGHRRFIVDSPHANAIRDFYVYIDQKLGEVLQLLPHDTTVIVASDHGMIKQEGKININNWLIKEGYLVLKEGVDLSKSTRFKMELVDMDRSLAWGGGAYNGRISINKEKLGSKWRDVRDEIAEKITKIPDDKGNQLQTKVYTAEEIYQNVSHPECPDLTIYFDDLRWASNPDLVPEDLYSWHTAIGADSAGHSRQGLFIISGPEVKRRGLMNDVDIRQVAPTILTALNVAVPKDIVVGPINCFREEKNSSISQFVLDEKSRIAFGSDPLLKEVRPDYVRVKEQFQEDVSRAADEVAHSFGEKQDLFKEVFHFLVTAFGDQKRNDGITPLVFHSIYLVRLLYACGERDVSSILTTALHDVLEDTPVTVRTLSQQPFLRQYPQVIQHLSLLTENKSLSRDPHPSSLPPRYREHISRLIGAPREVVNTEIIDRLSDLMDLEYVLELPEQERKIRLQGKLLKVRSFVDNLTTGRTDYNQLCLAVFNERVKELESNYNLSAQMEVVHPRRSPDADYPRYPESSLITTKEGIQCKVYATHHPSGRVIVKPKYIPEDLLQDGDSFRKLKKRFLFQKSVFRFNLFNDKESGRENLAVLKRNLPHLLLSDKNHQQWFFAVPETDVLTVHDPRAGLCQFLKVPDADLDPYLKATRGIINLILQSGVSVSDLGISHSTLLGNYTPGKSDIDILIFGIENGWRVLKHMETVQHPLLKWKSREDWARYYKDRVVSKVFTEGEYVHNMVRKRDDGLFDGNVFSIFVVEMGTSEWYDWEDKHEPLATVVMQGVVKDCRYSHVRPGYYEIIQSRILEGYQEVPIERIVFWSRPFALQAKERERVEACGLLEKVTTPKGREFYQLVIGYMNTYTNEQGEKEYLKALLD